jgi:hypothetical protein
MEYSKKDRYYNNKGGYGNNYYGGGYSYQKKVSNKLLRGITTKEGKTTTINGEITGTTNTASITI